jgi:LEA14-like dessication related protein
MKTIKFFSVALALLLALSSCKVYPPVYKRVENFGARKINNEGVKLSGDLVFYNPNKFNFHVNEILMNVEIDGKHVATAGQLTEVAVNRGSEFTIPLDLVIKPDMTFNEIIKSVFNIFKTRQVDLTISGTIVVKALGIKIPITIKDNEKIDITKLK